MCNFTQAYQDLQQNVSNKYLDFIQECREIFQTYSQEKQKKCHTHHIVPRHHYKAHQLDPQTFDLSNNTVKLTFDDHVIAHELRYKVYGEYGDLAAVKYMQALSEQGMRAMQQAGGQAVNVKLKKEGRLMHDPQWQKEMAKRSMEKDNAKQTRSEGGKKGGRKRHENRILRVEDRYEWSVDDKPFLCTFNFNFGSDLLNDLQAARPTNLQRVSPLITGQRKKLYGWSCKKIESS